MNWTLLFLLITIIGTALADSLDDISFDDDVPAGSSLDDVSSNEENSSLFAKTEEERRAMLKRVLTAAFKKPGARTKLGQVLPIVRLMSPPQRLALASLVMAQVLADPHDPPPAVLDSKNLTTQLMLPISMDIASMFRGMGKEQEKEANEGRSNSYPNVLFNPHRAALGPNIRRPPPTLNGISRRNANVPSEKQTFPPKRRPLWPGPSKVPSRPTTTTTTKKPHSPVPTCTSMNNNLCTELHDYPEEEILKSIKRESNQDIFKILTNEPSQLKEGAQKPKVLERRQGEGESNKRSMCSSTVEYARPKKARATSGQWKFIVNTGDYTQTLRLELCSKPQSQCLFLAEDIDSTCEQTFNYHRLLTWDESNGLTMDVFKVPTCCSCKVLGYNGLPFLTPSPSTPMSPVTPAVPLGGIELADTNLVANDEPPVIRIPAPPPPSIQNNNNKHGVRVRPYAPPKRRPAVQHRGPPLPLEGETIATDDTRYPPFDNSLRRITRNNTVDTRYKFNPHLLIPPSPNNRHPAIPIDNFDTAHAESVPNSNFATSPASGPYVTSPTVTFTSPTNTSPSPTTPTKRINYSYHPIIDYFRPQVPQVAENRMGVDWTPIVGKSMQSSDEA